MKVPLRLSITDLKAPYKKGLLFSILILLITAWFSSGYNQSDEHFQLYEFAGLKLGINQEHDLAWEYDKQMRPTLQVGMIVLTQRAFHFIGVNNPFLIAFFFRILSAIFSFGVTLFLFLLWEKKFHAEKLKWWFFLCSFFLWFLFYNGVRFNSEMWSGHSFVLALCLFWYWKTPSKVQYLELGLLVGLSFLFRYQAAFMIAGWGLWLIFIHKEKWNKLIFFTLGGLLMVGLGVFIDRWFYGEWTLSLWNYFEQNILLDKASYFGVDPWWHYFPALFIKGIPPFSLIYLFSICIYFTKRPKSVITWISLLFIAIHLFIAHKELRFFYPLLPFLPIAIAISLQWVHEKIKPHFWEKRAVKNFIRFFWIQNGLLSLFIAFWPIVMEMNLYKTIYTQYKDPITLYGLKDNPFRMALEIHYYRRKNLCVMEIDTTSHLPMYEQGSYLLAIDKKKLDELETVKGKKQLIYTTYPEWIYFFNVNHWLDRSQCWMVYEVSASGLRTK